MSVDPAVQAVVTAIRALTAAQKTSLFESLRKHPSTIAGSGHRVLTSEMVETLQEAFRDLKANTEELRQSLNKAERDVVDYILKNIDGLRIEKLLVVRPRKERPSSPEIIRRNVEICDLHDADPKKWTFPELRKKFEMKHTRTVRRVFLGGCSP